MTKAKVPSVQKFRQVIWNYHKEHRRDFAWRDTHNPYRILVSEIMLQQTQTKRVVPKYESFLKQFPSTKALATAQLGSVLIAWQGLGYNRRAKALKHAAEIIEGKFGGRFPKNYQELLDLPGIGQSTAGALMAFAFNKPFAFIETNIRAVFIHFFFSDQITVKDADIVELIKKSIDRKNPREWYYALYDYGAMLKASGAKLNPKSAHYKKQSAFKGSNREVRSNMLKLLLKKHTLDEKTIKKSLSLSEEIVKKNLQAFEKEGIIVREIKSGRWKIA
jgi:A/G-specific adenine glycosylase